MINLAIKTTLVRMWAIHGQLHIFSIWDKYNSQGREGMSKYNNSQSERTERYNKRAYKMKCNF